MIRYQLVYGVLSTFPALLLLMGCATEPSAPPATTTQSQRHPELLIEQALTESLDGPLSVQVSTRRQSGSWWLLSGTILDPDGRPFDFSNTKFQPYIDKGVFDNVFIALLRQEIAEQSFTLRELTFGSTDTPVEQWINKYEVPIVLFDSPIGAESLQWQ